MTTQALNNAFVHPNIDQFNLLVKAQDELKEFKTLWQKLVRLPRYRTAVPPGPEGEAILPPVYDRYNTALAKADIMQGRTSLPAGMMRRLKEIIETRCPAKHRHHARGIELSPGDKPMDKTNVLVTIEDGGIAKAVEIAKETGKTIVTKDVWGQLTSEQRGKLADGTNGVHQYATEVVAAASVRNPTAYWPEGTGDYGVEVDVKPGVKRVYHVASKTIKLELQKMLRDDVTVSIGTKVGEFYGLRNGVFSFTTEGVARLGDCDGEGMSEESIRAKIEPFMLRDKHGYHGGDITQVGQCSWKIDGVFCLLQARHGTAELRFRNGEVWCGPTTLDINVAFELVGEEIYMLYVDEFQRNGIMLNKSVQDYFRSKLEFIIQLTTVEEENKKTVRTLTSVLSQENLPRDGIVIWGSTRQTHYKWANDVDITKRMAKQLQDENEGLVVEHYDDLEDGPIYQLTVVDAYTLRPTMKDGKPVARSAISKILPNKMKNVLSTLTDPTIHSIVRYHERAAQDQSHADCPVCKFIRPGC
jgi:hypothetical protein